MKCPCPSTNMASISGGPWPDISAHGAGQTGQSMTEYLLVLVALLGLAGAGWWGESGGVLQWLIEALRGFHQRFSVMLSLPL